MSLPMPKAKIGTVKAIPVSTAIGSDSSAHQDENPPKSAATAMKIVVATVRWPAIESRWPTRMSRMPSGEASIAW